MAQQLNNLITIGTLDSSKTSGATLQSLTNLKPPSDLGGTKDQPHISQTQKQLSAKHSTL